MNKQELEDRLIKFAVLIIRISDILPNTRAGATLAGQIVRSGTSPALNYGEAQSAESSKDFIHKNQVVLKELREIFVALKIIRMSEMVTSKKMIDSALSENNELISIFVATINTTKKNSKSRKTG